MYPIKQNQTAQPLVFLLVSSTDHLSGLTGASPTVTLSKNGGSFAAPSGTVSEIGNGWYKVAGNATDSNALGPLLLHATATGADPTDTRYDVVAFDPQAATNLGLTNLDTNIGSRSTFAGGAVASVTSPVNLNLSQTLSTARALDTIADTSLTINDGLHCAIGGTAGKTSQAGTTYTRETPFTGTVLRTFTLDSATQPSQRS